MKDNLPMFAGIIVVVVLALIMIPLLSTVTVDYIEESEQVYSETYTMTFTSSTTSDLFNYEGFLAWSFYWATQSNYTSLTANFNDTDHTVDEVDFIVNTFEYKEAVTDYNILELDLRDTAINHYTFNADSDFTVEYPITVVWSVNLTS